MTRSLRIDPKSFEEEVEEAEKEEAEEKKWEEEDKNEMEEEEEERLTNDWNDFMNLCQPLELFKVLVP